MNICIYMINIYIYILCLYINIYLYIIYIIYIYKYIYIYHILREVGVLNWKKFYTSQSYILDGKSVDTFLVMITRKECPFCS
jgi:hypothetical protein